MLKAVLKSRRLYDIVKSLVEILSMKGKLSFDL